MTELINKVKAKLDQVNDYVAKGTLKTDVTFIKAPAGKITVYFKKPDKFKLKKDGGISILPKGGISVNLNSIVTSNNYVALAAGESTIDGIKTKIVKLLPTDENSDIILSTLYIDEANLLIRKAITTTKENGTYEITMSYGKYSNYALPDKVIFNSTLRLLLTKPVSKTEFMLAKFFAASTYTFILLLWIAILALVLSISLFGTDDLILQKTSYVVQIESNDIFWRYIGAFCFALLSMLTVTALGFFLSNFAENSIGPIVTAMSIIIVFTILSTMTIPVFEKIQPYLFTTHMVNWKEFFDEKVNDQNIVIKGSIQSPQKIYDSAIVLIIHIVVLVGAAIVVFKRKDVLS